MLWKKTIVMMVAFGVLTIAALGFSALPTGSRGPGIELPAMPADAVNKIEVTNISDPLTLEKSGAAWSLVPIGKPADAKRVDSALKTLAELKIGTIVSKSSANFKKYGVEDDSMTLAVYTGTDKPFKLIVGNESGDKRGNYARIPGDDRVFSTSKRIKSLFQKKPDNWRDKTIVSFEGDAARKLLISYEGQKVSFEKSESGNWTFAPVPENLPGDFELDPEKVDQIVRSLSNLRASDFEDAVTADMKTGLDTPSVKLIVEMKEGDPIQVLLGNDKEKKTYISKVGSEQVYMVNEYVAKKLKMKTEDFRDLHLAHLDSQSVKEVEIDLGQKKFTFKKEKQWTLTDSSESPPANFRLDPEKVESLVSSASRFQAKKLIGKSAPAGSGLGKPSGTVTLTMDDGSKKKIRIGSETESNERYAQGDDGTVYLAAKYGADRFIKPLDHYKVTAKQQQQPTLSPDALKNLPPEVAQQLMQKQRQQIMQKQIMKQMQKQQKGGK